jgi:lysozyme family protein
VANFEKAVEKVLDLEKGYVNNPNDHGGETNWGIAKSTAQAYGYRGAMKDLKREEAIAIYKQGYWDALRLDKVKNQLIAENLFDVRVNGGTPIVWTQRAVNTININEHGKRLWKDIKVDGKLGPITLGVLNKIAERSFLEKIFLKVFNTFRSYYFVLLSEKSVTQKEFVHGWIAHRVWLDVDRKE